MKYKMERISSILAAIILLQTLYFKFSAAPESVYIFSSMGIEPYGRIAAGVAELIISFLLLIKRHSLLGAFLGLGMISGAIATHIFVLGIEVQNDGGTLFLLAVAVFVFCSISIILQREKLLRIVKIIY